jgi:DNA replication and repair protein RecF
LLTSLSLYQFKNYSKQSFEFKQPICCFHGPNGIGKTNLLDAIYYLCFTKSYFSSYDHQVVQIEKKGMYTKGLINQEKIDCIIRENGKKEISLNGKIYSKNAEHIGKFPAVIISPDDIGLLNGYSDSRRRFIDRLLCQLDSDYLNSLIEYGHYLAQRNALLKSSKNQTIDATLHDHYKEQLCSHARIIYNRREKIITTLLPKAQEYYGLISKHQELIYLKYKSQLTGNKLEDLFKESLEKDFITQRTNVGIHKDDIVFEINKQAIKTNASQGQKKSFLFALKFAAFSILREELSNSPILLLDDIFEKLDATRSQQLVNLITQLDTQVFITDTHEQRLKEAFKNVKNVQFEKITSA